MKIEQAYFAGLKFHNLAIKICYDDCASCILQALQKEGDMMHEKRAQTMKLKYRNTEHGQE